jgi:hypothetical protein
MRKKIILSLLLSYLSFMPFYSWSQQTEIRGKIIDKETSEVVPFSTISLKDSKIGTCSNSRGEFIFHYPDSLKSSDLKVCCIGYKTKVIQLNSLPSTEIATIYLESEIYEIPEIQIGPNQPTATDMVRHVIRNMHKNYPRSPYYMEGFLRDKVFNLYNNKNVRLTESAVEIRKKEFGNENNADRVKVIEIRNSYNYSKLGSLWKEKLTRVFWGYSTDNPLYNVLQNKDLTDPNALRELVKSDLYNIYISGYTMFDGKPVVIIDLKQEYYEFLFQKKSTNNRLYNLVKLYFDCQSYAMLKTEAYTIMNFSKLNLDKDFKLNMKQDTIGSFAVKQYEKIDGQYYLKYAGYFGRVHDQPDTGELGKTLYCNETELLINKLITNRKEFNRIKHCDLLEKETPLWDMKYVYDPSFWRNYNILIDKPLDPTVQKDLEKEVPLYDQFIDAGVKNSTTPK